MFRHIEVALVVACDPRWAIEVSARAAPVSVGAAPAASNRRHLAILCDLPDAVAALIRHIEVALVIACDPRWAIEMSARAAPVSVRAAPAAREGRHLGHGGHCGPTRPTARPTNDSAPGPDRAMSRMMEWQPPRRPAETNEPARSENRTPKPASRPPSPQRRTIHRPGDPKTAPTTPDRNSRAKTRPNSDPRPTAAKIQ